VKTTESTDAAFLFAIPFAAKSIVTDWDVACAALTRTLESVVNQTDQDFTIVICGHDEPDLPDHLAERIEYLQADWDAPTEQTQRMANDKGRKRTRIARWFGAEGGGYFFGLDADDLVSRRLVEFVRSDGDPNGYVIEAGYVLDDATSRIAPVDKVWANVAYDVVCGSCLIVNVIPDELPGGDAFERDEGLYQLIRHHKHAEVKGAAADAGRPLKAIPFAAGVYVLNTGNNISYVLRRDAARQETLHAKIEKQALSVTDELTAEFGLRSLDTSGA
jgi:hypothetical protein